MSLQVHLIALMLRLPQSGCSLGPGQHRSCRASLCPCWQVEIGAFRTYPEGYKPPDEGPSEYQTIPLSKIEDFGVHAKQVSCSGGRKDGSDYVQVL
jgi:hypothetical protein